MAKKDYKWKRFWCPRSGHINLADGGYLCDPDGEWGRAHNPDLVSLEAIAEIPCLVLLGEPGIGKSQELENLKDLTENHSSQVLELNLRSCTNLKEDLFKDETFTDWLGGNYHLYLFLDSLDEGLLSIPTLATALIDELRKPKYRNHINRLHLRLACRTFVFPEILEEGLKELWKEANFETYELAPLRRVDVSEAAKAEGFSSDDFLKEIDQKDIVPLAIKPITLRFLLNTYRRHSGQFPSNQRLHELYLEGCKVLCEEINESRRGSNRIGNLDTEQRLIVAARIAAVTIFTNRFAIWTGIDQGDIPAEDVFLQRLYFGCEKANGREVEVTREAIKEVLDTGLFSSRGLHRMGWAHQTYAEFLAAWYLTQHNLNLPQILSLILHPDGRVIPQLQETTAWLASMKPDVFQKIMETDPDVLLQSDLTIVDEVIKASLVESLLKLYNQNKLVYQYRFRAYEILRHSGLPTQLESYIRDSTKSIHARYAAIDIAENCNVQAVQSDLADVALNPKQPYWIRTRAASALVHVGDEQTKGRLKPLVFGSEDDLEDELKGYALQAVYPTDITTEEVLNCLTQPKGNYIGGCYQDFVADELGQRLPKDDLPLALSWLEQQSTRRDLHYPFDAFSDTIILKAWEHFENPEILSRFARIALVRLSQYDELIDTNEISFKQLLEENDFKRRQLLDAVVSVIPKSEKEPFWLAGYSEYGHLTPLKQDFFWLIEKLQTSEFDHTQRIYSKLIRWNLDWRSAEQINAVLTASQINPNLRAEFASELEPILLNSPRANQAKSEYIRHQEMLTPKDKRKVLDPSPKERILTCLNQFEAGSVDAWWHLCRELTLLPTSTHYNERFKADITTLPGWEEADETTKLRIIAAAKKYIYQGEPETDEWLGTNSFRLSALAGYRALRLISATDPNFISTISANVWQKWAAIILDFPNVREDKNEIRQQLLKRAYQNAPDELIKVLIILIDQENAQHGSIHILHEIRCCWNERLAEVLLNKVQDKRLKARSIGDLLKELLVHRVDRAKAFAESLIFLPPPADSEARAKAIVAAQMLMLYAEDAGWSVVWSAIQQDPKFGREVLEAVSYAVKYQGDIEQRLKENCVADLYIFLSHQYPTLEEQQKDSDNAELTGVEAYVVEPEDSIRTWKNYIPQRLQELGTQEACDALRKIIHELPELKESLQWRLLEAEALVRRKTWQPPTPEEFLQLVNKQQLNQFQGLTNVTNFNFDQRGATIGVNVANEGSNIKFIQHARQNINISEQDLAESAQKIQALLNQLAQAYPITTEQQQQTFIQKFLEQVESTPDLIQVFLAGGIEGLKILCPLVGIPIEVLRRLYEVVKERHNKA